MWLLWICVRCVHCTSLCIDWFAESPYRTNLTLYDSIRTFYVMSLMISACQRARKTIQRLPNEFIISYVFFRSLLLFSLLAVSTNKYVHKVMLCVFDVFNFSNRHFALFHGTKRVCVCVFVYVDRKHKHVNHLCHNNKFYSNSKFRNRRRSKYFACMCVWLERARISKINK